VCKRLILIMDVLPYREFGHGGVTSSEYRHTRVITPEGLNVSEYSE
jgi:hypothetical protein